MNKLSVALLLAAGLFILDVSPATAHPGFDGVRVHSYSHSPRAIRHHDMPRWLKRDHGFRHWYRHSPLRRYHQIGWNQLFEIYRWERRYFGSRHRVRHDHDGRRWDDRRRKYGYDD